MKTLSRTFVSKLIVLTAVAIVATLAYHAFSAAPPPPMPTCSPGFAHPKKIVKEIRGSGGNQYAELKNPDGVDFDKALNTLQKNGGQYCIRFLSKPDATPEEPYKPHHLASIKTDKVTKSEVANSATDASVANDPSAVYRITSDSQADIDAVMKCFQ